MAQSDYSDRIDRVKRYIEENCRRSLSLGEMAEISCFSPYHFHRIFKAETGESPADYQKRIRLNRAASELYKPHMTIARIADDYRFSSPAAFSRDFKKFYGAPPREFQKGLYRERAVRREKEMPFGNDYQAEDFASPCHAACLYTGSVMMLTRAFDCLYRDWLPPSGFFPAEESPFILFGKMTGFTSLFTPVRCRAEVCLPLIKPD